MKLRGHPVGSWRAATIGPVLAVLLGLLFMTPLGDRLVYLSYELPFYFRPETNIQDVVILYMDDESHKNLGQPSLQAWDRSIHARAVDRLTEWKAKAIVFDVLFDTRHSEAEDNRLVAAVQKHGNVLFGAQLAPDIVEGKVIGARPAVPFTNAFLWGMTEMVADGTIVRQHYRDNASHEKSLAWVTAEATGSRPPGDPSTARWLNYYGMPGLLPHFSYYGAISNTIPPTAISNKVIFIGAHYGVGFTGGLGTDDYRTPYSRWTGTKSPGVEVNATAYLNLMRGDWLNEMPVRYELGLVLLCGMLFGGCLQLLPPMPGAAAAAACALGISAAAMWWMWHSLIWFPWLVIAGVQVPTAFLWSVIAHTKRLQQEKESLEFQLAAAQLGTSRSQTIGNRTEGLETLKGSIAEASEDTGVIPIRIEKEAESELTPTASISDHELVRCIGRGAYGEVWLAKDVIGTFHAVKVIYRRSFKDSGPFEREFRGIQKFTPISRSHPGFVNILHVGRNDEAGYFFYIMELGDDAKMGQAVDGVEYFPKTLATEMKARGRLPGSEVLAIAIGLCSALQHLHQHKLIHRDIKPANIIFVHGAPKLADIGLVTEIGGGGREVTYIGTEGYIPPEGPGTAGADIFSLGKVLYQMCSGLECHRFPELPTTLMGGLKAGPLLAQINKIILKACENEASKRYQSAAQMLADLKQLEAAV